MNAREIRLSTATFWLSLAITVLLVPIAYGVWANLTKTALLEERVIVLERWIVLLAQERELEIQKCKPLTYQEPEAEIKE